MIRKKISQKILQQIGPKIREQGNSKIFHIEEYATNKDNSIIFAQYYEVLGREPEGKYILIVDTKSYFIHTIYLVHIEGEKVYIDGRFFNGQGGHYPTKKLFKHKDEFIEISKIANNAYKALHDSSQEFVFPSTVFGYNTYF